jgi:tetratricopeptide (TPR) repeat protein
MKMAAFNRDDAALGCPLLAIFIANFKLRLLFVSVSMTALLLAFGGIKSLADDGGDSQYRGRIEENSTIKPEDLFFGTGIPSNDEILRRAAASQESNGLSLTTTKSLPSNTFERLWQTYMRQGGQAYRGKDLAEAETMYRGAVKVAEKFPVGDKRLATTLTNLGAVLRDAGKWEEAETVFKRALAIKDEHLDPGDPSLASTLNHYANLLKKMGRGDEAQMMEARAQSITALAASARENRLLLEKEMAASVPRALEPATEEPLLSAFARTNREASEQQKPAPGLNDHHQITNVLILGPHRKQQEPFWFTRQIVVAYGDGGGNWTTNVGPRETYSGYLGSNEVNDTNAELYDLATKYGIGDDSMEIIARNGGTLLEVDNNTLFYARCPINQNRWPVGLEVQIGRPEFLEEPMYMIKSQDEHGQIIVREMASR